jgi:hypothetical protein
MKSAVADPAEADIYYTLSRKSADTKYYDAQAMSSE